MRILTSGTVLLAGCSLYFGSGGGGAGGGVSGGGFGGGGAIGDASEPDVSHCCSVHTLTLDHAVGAESTVRGVDADQQGGLWLAYTTGLAPMGSARVDPTVSLVHWDPATRTRLATYTYDDLQSPVSGLALVNGQIWLNYEEVTDSDQVIRVIDPATGKILNTFGTTGIDLGAMGSNLVAVSTASGVVELDATTGGTVASFASPTVLNDFGMPITFTGTEQGIAWRPGEIWVANWLMPSEVFDESGNWLGTQTIPGIISESADPTAYLAFDRGMLLVGYGGQLTWYDVQ